MSASRDLLRETNQKILARKRRVLKRKIRFFGILSLFLVVLILFFITRPLFEVGDVKVSGGSEELNSSVKLDVSEIISKRRLFVFSNSNFFFMPRSTILSSVMQKYNEVEKMDLKIGKDTLHVDLLPRDRKYIYCTMGEYESCFHTDEQGLVFMSANEIDTKLIFTQNDTRAEVALGEYVYSEGDFVYALKGVDILADLNFSVWKVENDVDSMSFYVRGGTEFSRIIVDKNEDMDKNAINLKTAISNAPLSTEIDQNMIGLEYIDLRFENKVYYKFEGMNESL